MLRRLDRYLLSELVGPFGLGLLVYTFILLIQLFFRMAEMIIKRGLPVATVGRLLLYSLPNIIVLTLPMSLLLAVLLGIGRLASDSELVALRASGVSLYRILRPVMLFAAVLAGVNTYFMLELLPRGNSAYTRMVVEIATRTLGSQFEPRIFYNEFQGKVLYVFDTDVRGNDWRGVFLADSVATPDRPNDVIFAERGRLELSEGGEQVVLQLQNAVQHTYDLTRPDRYETRRYEKLRILLRDRFASEERARALSQKNVRSMTLAEASAAARDPKSPPQLRADATVQIHKMFSIPAACLVFALLAVPLAFSNRRGGKSSGFALSIGIVVVYYVLLSQGEKASILGKMPAWLAMWLPNLLLGGLGVVVLIARDRDRSPIPAWLLRSPVVRRLRAGWNVRFGRRERREPAKTAGEGRGKGVRPRRGGSSFVVRLPRLRLRFPNIIDRYILRNFAFILVLVLASGVALLMITDFTDNVDEILSNHPPVGIVLRYYKYLSLQLAYDIAPIAVLVTTLVTFSLLSRSNEVTACRALGVSLYRLALPALAGAASVAGLFALLQAEVLPASNQKVAEAKSVIRGQPSANRARSADQQWQLGQGRYLYNFLHFDEKNASLQRLQVFELDQQSGMAARLYAEDARFSNGHWVLGRGWARTFRGREQLQFSRFDGEVKVDLRETPPFFAQDARKPSQMTFGELSAYTAELRETGRPQPQYEVALHNKIAFPFGSVVMALVGFPFAFRLQKRGALYGLGVSIGLGLVFILVYALFSTLGEVGALPPPVAVWSPSTLFALLAGYLFLGVRS